MAAAAAGNAAQAAMTRLLASDPEVSVPLFVPPTASLQRRQPALTVTAVNYTALTSDEIIKVTATGKTVTLYAAAAGTGKTLAIDNAASGPIIVDGNGSETIEGQLRQTVPANSCMVLYSDGTSWRIT